MTKTKPNKLRYIKEYDKNKRIQVVIKLNKETDSDIIEILNQVESKQGYIKSLIREDIKKRHPCNKKSVECIFCEWFQDDKSLGGYVCCAPEYIRKGSKKP